MVAKQIDRGGRMDYHYHARLTVHGREELAQAVLLCRLSLQEAAAEFKLSRQSAAKWVRRFRIEGVSGLRDRSSRPHCSPRRTAAEPMAQVERLRRERWTGMRIAQATGLSRATVSRILTRLQLKQNPHAGTCSAHRALRTSRPRRPAA